MTVSSRFILEQGPVIKALGGVALAAITPKAKIAANSVPGPWIEATLEPRSPELLRTYIRHVGGDPSWYRNQIPAHLFPQWGFGLAAQALSGAPYPMTKVMNAGCRIEQYSPLPANEPLQVKARVESIDDDGRRALITQRIITSTASAPNALIAELRAFVPLSSPSKDNGAKKETKAKPTVPANAREIGYLRLSKDAGLDFAKLTGDFNPIHWLPFYAKAAGFRSCILHGFGTLARAIETLNRSVWSGDVNQLSTIDVKFTRPLFLPAKVGVYLAGNNELFVGDAPSGGAYLEGTFSKKP